MVLPLQPPFRPMLAKRRRHSKGDGWHYEPKWDGFRCIVFRDGDNIELASRNERPSPATSPSSWSRCWHRCRSDASSTARSSSPAGDAGLDFDALLQRIHPAESRVRRLAAETPASFVAFDLLALDDDSLLDVRSRAPRPAAAGARAPRRRCTCARRPPIRDAGRWFTGSRAPASTASSPSGSRTPTRPDKRTLIKVKHQRTADCVVAGYRIHKDGNGVGSLLLGLYDDEGESAPRRRRGVVHGQAARRTARRARAADPRRRSTTIRGADWAEWSTPRPAPHARARRVAGTPARTSGGFRSRSSASPR